MSNNRKIQMLIAVALIVIAFLATISAVNASAPSNAMVPITGAEAARDYSDYYQRHSELSAAERSTVNMSDYFFRHPELRSSTKSVDLSDDYYFRHPELNVR